MSIFKEDKNRVTTREVAEHYGLKVKRNSPYLATKKIGKNNPKFEVLKADIYLKKEWNNMVDRGIISRISEEEICSKKKQNILQNQLQNPSRKVEISLENLHGSFRRQSYVKMYG